MKSFRIALAFAAAVMAAPAFAQEEGGQAPAQQQKAPQPDVVKEFKDWTVRCYPVNSVSPCEMLHLRIAKKSGQRVLGILVAYVPSRDAHIMQISTPLGVALANGLVINADTYKSGVLKFRRCDQLGCYVETAVGSDVMGQIGRAKKGQMEIVSVDGRRFNLPFSVDGFTEAHQALVELTKQKAKAPPAETPAQP